MVSHLNVEQSDQKVSNPCQIVSFVEFLEAKKGGGKYSFLYSE